LQLLEFFDVLRGEEVGSSAHELTELDKTGPQLFQAESESPRRREAELEEKLLFLAPFSLTLPTPEQALRDITHTVFEQHPADGTKSP
jgi:hypothetical protein